MSEQSEALANVDPWHWRTAAPESGVYWIYQGPGRPIERKYMGAGDRLYVWAFIVDANDPPPPRPKE